MLTADQISNVNKNIKTTPIKGKNYAEVSERIKAFRQICPNGSIQTEIISLENGVVTMKATIIDEDGKVLATGFAQEKETSSYINKTSFIENCETSAVGRALGMCGLGVEGSIASALEVANAIENQNDNPNASKPATQKPQGQPPVRQDTKAEAELNKQLVESVDQDLVPHGEGMTPKRIARIKKAMEFTGKNEKTVLATAKANSYEEISEASYISVMNLFFKLMTEDQKAAIHAI